MPITRKVQEHNRELVRIGGKVVAQWEGKKVFAEVTEKKKKKRTLATFKTEKD